MFRFHKQNIYFKWGLTVFLTVLAILSAYDLLFGEHKIADYLGVLGAIITPVVYGGAIAYLLAPIVDFLERTILRPLAWDGVQKRKPKAWVRVISVLLTLILVIGALVALLAVLIPDVISSAMQLVENLPMYAAVVQGLLENAETAVSLPAAVMEKVAELSNHAMDVLNHMTSVTVPDVVESISGGVMGTLRFTGNMILGLVVAAYMMGMKETLVAQCKKIIRACLDDIYVEKVMKALNYTDEVFGGFIRGNLLDALLVGVVCFVFFKLFGFPYAPLLSVLIGVTNLIPFFGPFLGAIPSCILIFLVDPIMCLEFIVFILILQQIDGNIIAPKILGQSTGLASLWVIIAILVGGGLFGPIGMLLGCPIFALIYGLFRLWVEKGLERREMPIPTDEYREIGMPDHMEAEEK